MAKHKYTKRYERAKKFRDNWIPVMEDCYHYGIPHSESFNSTSPGEQRDDVFDETAVVSTQEFASRLQHAMVPNFVSWADLVAGSEVPEEERERVNAELQEVSDYAFQVIHNSNFSTEVHEAFLDLAVGTGVLYVDEGDAIDPIIFSAVPLPHVVIDVGFDGRTDHIFRERRDVYYSELEQAYPQAKLSEQMKRKAINEDDKTTVLEVVCRDYSKKNRMAWKFVAIEMAEEAVIYETEFEGIGANPMVVFRWTKRAGERYGRGPLMNAISAIKTCNLTVQLILENAQMAIAGIYQMEDDGVVNPDTINLVPGTVIPKAPGSRGLEPIAQAGRFDVAQLVLEDQRLNIKKALFNDMLADPNRTPASATEVAERMADLARKMSAAFGRLHSELVTPVIQRVLYILKKQGRIELPVVNGREVAVRATSPLAKAQAMEDVQNIARFIELTGTFFGPEMLQILIDSEEAVLYLARKMGVPDNLLRDKANREAIVAQLQQSLGEAQNGAAAQGDGAGRNPPQPGIGAAA